MTKIKKLKCRNYSIIVGENAFENLEKYVNFSRYSQVVLISEKKIYNLWKSKIDSILKTQNKILLPSGEQTKCIKTTEMICEKLVEFGADRKTLIVNIGGGMITDLGGFSASIYMRGVDYVNIPTSLLAMVDAPIGGKNGVNLGSVKNIIGIFGHPKAVIIDVSFLQTLEKREYISAFGEIVKHAIIFDKKYFNVLTRCNEIDDKKMLLKIISRSLKIKKNIVEKDFQEKNIRKLLNFGHTIGHVIEALAMKTDKPLLHGEAVAIGMVVECKIAEKLNLFSPDDTKKIVNLLNKCGFENVLKMKFDFKIDDILNIIKKDKKNVSGAVKMSLPVKIGKSKYNIEVQEKIIIECVKNVLI